MYLRQKIPQPTVENPYAQVKFIFETVAKTKNSRSTIQNFRNACSFYIRFLEDTRNYDISLAEEPRFYLKKHWDEYCLLKVERYLSETNIKGNEGYLTSHTITGYISSLRQVMVYAGNHNLCSTENFFDVNLGTSERETNIRNSYSTREYDEISSMLNQELKFVYRLRSGQGYEKTGVGRDPRVVPRKNVPRGVKIEGYGWKEIDNVRWYFENIMNCQPLPGTPENKQRFNTFFANATNKFKHLGGLNGIYRKWGVASLVNSEVIMPLAVKLISETGLNPESLWDLEIDCYEKEHPLSGVPYIKYFKRRSGGEKELHISISGNNVETKEFREHQAKIIEKTIEHIIKITLPIRENAHESIKTKLFIFQSDSPRNFGRIKVINPSISSNWCNKMVNRYGLKGDVELKLEFNLARFRPTRITQLVEKGVDFFEIQHEAGHKHISSTLRYLEINRLNLKAKEETNIALENITQNRIWAEKEKPSYAENDLPGSKLIYKGIMCDCKNPYDPPKEVKRLKNYQNGQSCNRYNMCLFCPNVILFKKHLPLIASYKKQIETAMSIEIGEIPNQFLYNQTLDIINSLLDPDKSEFSEKDIKLAIEAAENIDIMIDHVVYNPVLEH
ncbi:site-specific integrase [Peribacillus butanolivorans]|uniref:site-specific integrase n=1 Tax=Peribacillus butanolivorans TaxID=421767 RepID=UPI003665C8CF